MLRYHFVFQRKQLWKTQCCLQLFRFLKIFFKNYYYPIYNLIWTQWITYHAMLQKSNYLFPLCYLKLMLEVKFCVQSFDGNNKWSNFNFSKIAVTLNTSRQSACFSVEKFWPFKILCIYSKCKLASKFRKEIKSSFIIYWHRWFWVQFLKILERGKFSNAFLLPIVHFPV